MKKTIMLMGFALVISGVFAQESGGMASKTQESGGLVSKKGETILPEANDWALSIDAAPVMYYLGNMLNGNSNNASPAWRYPGTPLAITGKLFKDEKTAYRAMVRIGFGSSTQNNYVRDDINFTADPNAQVNDSWKYSYHNIVLGAGLEKRRGKTRLQGYYGGMFMIGLGGSKNTYSYGNAYSSTNTTPTSTIWTSTVTSGPAPSRVTENKSGGSFMVGLRGFIGAEYFIFPKMSVGAEFGWGIGMTSKSEGEIVTESWNAAVTPPAVKSSTSKTGKSSTFGLDTDINGSQMIPTGALTLTMHF